MLEWIKKNSRGQSMTEYVIIVAVIAIAAIAVVMLFGKQIRHAFLTMTHSLAGTGTGQQADQAKEAGETGKDQDMGLDDFDEAPR